MKKKSVLILQGSIPNYRKEIFESLNDAYDITVGYTESNSVNNSKFKVKRIPFKRFWNIYFPTKFFFRYINKFDVIILMPDLHYVNYCIIPFLPLKSKTLSFSIGFRASYKVPYKTDRIKSLKDYILLLIYKMCHANIFYYYYPVDFWGKLLNNRKTFIANNTISVLNLKPEKLKKESILFIGSLIPGKGLITLLESYKSALKKSRSRLSDLIIIGKGPLEKDLKKFIAENQLLEKVKLVGAVYDEKILSNYFRKAICCISPNQAGLSVLKSFGYGVPFITRQNSITGGERLNIINGYNGILYKTDLELTEIILSTNKNFDDFFDMGINAQKFYYNNATIEIMKNNFVRAIDFALGEV